MLSTAEQAADVIPILYNELKSNGLSDIKTTCCDNIGWKSQMEYTEKLAELDVEKYLGVITSHQYSSDPEMPMNTTLPTWMTEGAANDDTFATAWYSNGGSNEGFTWAVKIAQGIVNAELSAYIYWEGLETNNKGSLSHMIDTDGTNFSISSILWAMAHWSRHIRPGAHRLSTNGIVQDTIVGAFENVDGSVVMVLTNSGTAAQTVDLSVPGGSFSTAQAFTSDAESQIVDTQVTLSNGAVKVTVPVHGVVTVKLTTGKSSASVSTTIPSTSTPAATSENQTSVYQTVSATTLSVVRASTYAQSTAVAVSTKAVSDTASTAPAASTGLSKSLEGSTTKKSVHRPQKTHGTAHHRCGRRGSHHHDH
ncbi:carbohydrate-binding module family 1 [Fusarium mundagurra]|uniref:Carbohydrate-binding module family 1 n=1 Tax=Fusarium mundagurra TaxID=1567541 RepID=A0A8H6D5H5_9HYPO|nr:carbohydrate-binding module family 1 [Fusarium mundagurra]